MALLPVSFSYGKAMASPGQTPLSVRSVDWLRSVGGAPLVSWVERAWYSHHQPPTGGLPPAGLIPPGASSAPSVPPASARSRAPRGLPVTIPPVVDPALPGEGVWQPAGRRVMGRSAVYEAFVRPDAVHTSLVTGVAWMDPHLLKFKMFAGAQQPGGTWALGSPVPASLRPGLVAAFNSGFRLQDSRGGYFADGRTAGRLVSGAASFVIRSDGTATVGRWGRDVRAGPAVVAVRQNLSLLVDRGRPVSGLARDSLAKWGATLGNRVLVWRSGIGVTAAGALVYAAGPGLSVASLAGVLARAGAVRAMELDINTTWVDYFTFDPAPGSPAAPSNGSRLLSAMVRPPSRYFSPTARDFIAAFAR
ncbi:MAG: phosphodiester glycosidase family protein [Acidimicrobiales bacterium]